MEKKDETEREDPWGRLIASMTRHEFGVPSIVGTDESGRPLHQYRSRAYIAPEIYSVKNYPESIVVPSRESWPILTANSVKNITWHLHRLQPPTKYSPYYPEYLTMLWAAEHKVESVVDFILHWQERAATTYFGVNTVRLEVRSFPSGPCEFDMWQNDENIIVCEGGGRPSVNVLFVYNMETGEVTPGGMDISMSKSELLLDIRFKLKIDKVVYTLYGSVEKIGEIQLGNMTFKYGFDAAKKVIAGRESHVQHVRAYRHFTQLERHRWFLLDEYGEWHNWIEDNGSIDDEPEEVSSARAYFASLVE